MLMPILAVKTSLPNLQAASPETADAVQSAQRRPISVSPVQSDVVMKIVDTLSRHFMGKDVLPPEALARLVETLAKILKVQQLPNETIVDFARRLATFIETMPPELRQLAEKQLGLRALGIPARMLAEALRNPNGSDAAKIVTVLESTPHLATSAAPKTGAVLQQQQGPQAQLAASLRAGFTEPLADAERLQSVLKQTFGEGEQVRTTVRPASTLENPTTERTGTKPVPAEAANEKQEVSGKRQALVQQTASRELPMPNGRTASSFAAESRAAMVPVADRGGDQPVAQATSARLAQGAQKVPAVVETEARGADGKSMNAVPVPMQDELVSDGRGLAEVIANLADENVEELVQKLNRILEDVKAPAVLLLAAEGETEGGHHPDPTAVPLEVNSGGETALEEALAEDAGSSETMKPAEQQIAGQDGAPGGKDADTARTRTLPMPVTEDVHHDPALLARAPDLLVPREIIPYAVLHYLPADTETVADTEEEAPSFAEEEKQDEGADDNGQDPEPPTQEVAAETAPAYHPVLDALPDETVANDVAYEAYIRMGGIL